MKEWDEKRKYEVTFEHNIENHLTLMKFLQDNYGIDAIKHYYETRNDLCYQVKIGTIVKVGAKVIKTISSQKFFNIFLDQLIKNAQNMIPIKCISGIDQEGKRAVIHIDNCLTKRVFRRNIKRFKLQDEIPVTNFCEFDCIPTFQTYGRIGNIKVSATFREKGCDILVEIPKDQTLE